MRKPVPPKITWAFGGALDIVAVTSLIWFAYYVNGTDIWYLWTYLFLYGFLISTWLDAKILRLMTQRSWNSVRQRPKINWHYRAIVFCFILGPAIISSNYQAARAVWNGLQLQNAQEAKNAVKISGVWVRPEIGYFLKEKAGYLLGQEDKEALIYVTANSYLMPLLTGVYSKLPVMDAYYGTLGKQDFGILVARILELAPKRILFDDPKLNHGVPDPQLKFYARLQQSLTEEYQPVATAHGWQIWEKRKLYSQSSG